MKILLVVPPTGLYIREDRCQAPVNGLMAQSIRPPMDLAYIASVIRGNEDVECIIKDYPAEGGDWSEFKDDIKLIVPKYLIVSTTSPTFNEDIKSFRIAKDLFQDDIINIGKGAHFSDPDSDPLADCQDLDIAVRKESELTISSIVSGHSLAEIKNISYRCNEQIKYNDDSSEFYDIDLLPFPARDLINNKLYVDPENGAPLTPILTSRGCPALCVFCPVFLVSGRRLRLRSVDLIINEIKECIDKYEIKSFLFRSDTFTMDRKWLLELCSKIIENNLDIRWGANSRIDTIDYEKVKAMSDAGCSVISFGVESGDGEIQKHIKKFLKLDDVKKAVKICRDCKVMSMLYFVIGLPWDNVETIRNTVIFAKNSRADFFEFHSAYPFPGTEMYNLGLKDKLFSKEDLKYGNYFTPIMDTYYLSKQEVNYERRRAIISVYFSMSFIIRTFIRLKSPKVILRYLYFGIGKFSHLLFHKY